MDITTTEEWTKVAAQATEFDGLDLRRLFAEDPSRAETLTLSVGDLVVDMSEHRVTEAILADLVSLAVRAGLPAQIEAMLRGDHINTTEDRAVLHTALRAPIDRVIETDDDGTRVDVVPAVHDVLRKMTAFSDRVRDGDWTGHTGALIETVVNIGIGGSDLGPVMAYEALAAVRHPRLRCRFVSNVDGSDLYEAVRDLDPATTLFVVASKTFTTQETLTNAQSVLRWLGDNGVSDPGGRVIALTANPEQAVEWGVDETRILPFPETIGGRYSLRGFLFK